MKINKIIKDEVDSLIALGSELVQKASVSDSHLEGNDIAQVSLWVTRLGQVIRNLYGENSQHFENYHKTISLEHFYTIHSYYYNHISQLYGIVLAIKHDIKHDLLINIKYLLQAEIFADFLEIGEHLLNGGYKDAAAITIGTVLENGLKKLCEKNDIPIIKPNGSPKTIDPLNTELAKRGVYSQLMQKQITSWAHIRNKAAHGEYDEYDKKQVEMMLLFVRNFSEEYLV